MNRAPVVTANGPPEAINREKMAGDERVGNPLPPRCVLELAVSNEKRRADPVSSLLLLSVSRSFFFCLNNAGFRNNRPGRRDLFANSRSRVEASGLFLFGERA